MTLMTQGALYQAILLAIKKCRAGFSKSQDPNIKNSE